MDQTIKPTQNQNSKSDCLCIVYRQQDLLDVDMLPMKDGSRRLKIVYPDSLLQFQYQFAKLFHTSFPFGFRRSLSFPTKQRLGAL